MSAKQKQSEVTQYIAHQKSHQKFIPLVCELIEKAHVRTLSLKKGMHWPTSQGLTERSPWQVKHPINT